MPDMHVTYDFQGLLKESSADEWTPAAELRARHFLSRKQLAGLTARAEQIRTQLDTERHLRDVPPELRPLDAGFIDGPRHMLEAHRSTGDRTELGRILATANRIRTEADIAVMLGIGGSYLGARALFEALCSTYHNDLPSDKRNGVPRIFFEGNNADNDSLQDLLELLHSTCTKPDDRQQRWAVVVISKSGGTLETAAALRVVRREMARYYGPKSDRLRKLLVPITGATGKLRDLCRADGYADDDIFTIPDNVGGRYSVFTPVGLLPAAIMGLDVPALLQGAAAMTDTFFKEPFDRNPALQYAAVNYLMAEERGKPVRVLSVWSRKLEALGLWYDQLLAESLGKESRGPTPLTAVETRDLHSRGQQHQEGTRDKIINNLVIAKPRHEPVAIGKSDRNEDGLNRLANKTYPEILDAARRGTDEAYRDAARPTAEIRLSNLNEHALGELMQMLMLATVAEGRLLGINPYGQPGVEAYKRNMQRLLTGA